MSGPLGLGLGLGTVVLATASAGLAQPQQGPKAVAQSLFDEGREFVKRGDWDAGCPKFQASMDLDPSTGTKINIAACHSHEGKAAVAWGDYEEARRLNENDTNRARKQARDKVIEAGFAELKPRVARLRIVIASPPQGLRLTRDGEELPADAVGSVLVVDPGACDLLAEAPGYKSEHRRVTLAKGQDLDVPMPLAPDPPPPPPPPSPPPPSVVPVVPVTSAPTARTEEPPPRPPPPMPPPADGSKQRDIGIAIGSLGMASLVAAGGLTGLAFSKYGQSSPYCTPDNQCYQHGLDLRNDARQAMTGAYVLMGVGGTFVTVGAVLFAKAPRAAPRRDAANRHKLALTAGPGDVSLRLRF